MGKRQALKQPGSLLSYKEEIIWGRSKGSWDLLGESTGEDQVLQKSAVLFDTVNRNFYMQGMELHEVEQRATCGKKNYQATLS